MISKFIESLNDMIQTNHVNRTACEKMLEHFERAKDLDIETSINILEGNNNFLFDEYYSRYSVGFDAIECIKDYIGVA